MVILAEHIIPRAAGPCSLKPCVHRGKAETDFATDCIYHRWTVPGIRIELRFCCRITQHCNFSVKEEVQTLHLPASGSSCRSMADPPDGDPGGDPASSPGDASLSPQHGLPPHPELRRITRDTKDAGTTQQHSQQPTKPLASSSRAEAKEEAQNLTKWHGSSQA